MLNLSSYKNVFGLSVISATLIAMSACSSGSDAPVANNSTAPTLPSNGDSWDIYDYATISADVPASVSLTPVVEYIFDNAVAPDVVDQAGLVDATLTGGAILDGGISLDGMNTNASSTGALVVDASATLDSALAGDFSVSMWFHINSLGFAGNARLISKKADYTDATGFEIEISDTDDRIRFNGVGFGLAGPTPESAEVPFTPDTGWHHLAVTVEDSTNTVTIYVDGSAVTGTSTVASSIAASAEQLVVGALDSSGNAPFPGLIDNVSFYDGVLTATDVSNLYSNENFSPVLFAEYTFANGAESVDTSGNSYELTLTNITTGTGSLDLVSEYMWTKADQNSAAAGLAFSAMMTVEATVSISDDTISDYMLILSKKAAFEDTYGYELAYRPSTNELTFVGSGTKAVTATADLTVDQDYDIAVVVNGSFVSIYLDGSDITPTENEINNLRQGSQNLHIGSRPVETVDGDGVPHVLSPWIGSIDNVRLYDGLKSIAVTDIVPQ